MERFAKPQASQQEKRHLALLNKVLGLEISKPPSDSAVRYLFLQLGVQAFQSLLLQRMSQHPALADGVDVLVRDGKTLRGLNDRKPVHNRRTRVAGRPSIQFGFALTAPLSSEQD
jgi:hypothetical protein